MPDTKGIAINVIDWKDGREPEVALLILDSDQMVTISAESARLMAFSLMTCADIIEPPFVDEPSFFGDYDEDEDNDDDDEERDEDAEDDTE